MTGKYALVLGASGITGWAIVNELLTDHPDAQQFNKITALTNRPLPATAIPWPGSEKLNITSGIDLLKGSQEQLQEALEAGIPQVEKVTHVFFNCKPNVPTP
jgi:hypothetical protein